VPVMWELVTSQQEGARVAAALLAGAAVPSLFKQQVSRGGSGRAGKGRGQGQAAHTASALQ
jgi:hypothetical protein